SVQNVYGRWSDADTLMEGILNPVLRGLDAQTTYLAPERYRAFQITTKGEFGGLGLEVRLENGVLKIRAPIDDRPAGRAGLKPGDIILEVDGKSVQGLSLEQSVGRMRGPVNTPVTLTIERAKQSEPIQIRLVRETVKAVPVKGRLEGDVAYIKISTFSQQTQPVL